MACVWFASSSTQDGSHFRSFDLTFSFLRTKGVKLSRQRSCAFCVQPKSPQDRAVSAVHVHSKLVVCERKWPYFMLTEFLVWLALLFRFNSLSGEGSISPRLHWPSSPAQSPQRVGGMASSNTGRKKLSQRETGRGENTVDVKYRVNVSCTLGWWKYIFAAWLERRAEDSLTIWIDHPHPVRASHRHYMSPPVWWRCI